jgi:hypothetical protein
MLSVSTRLSMNCPPAQESALSRLPNPSPPVISTSWMVKANCPGPTESPSEAERSAVPQRESVRHSRAVVRSSCSSVLSIVCRVTLLLESPSKELPSSLTEFSTTPS